MAPFAGMVALQAGMLAPIARNTGFLSGTMAHFGQNSQTGGLLSIFGGPHNGERWSSHWRLVVSSGQNIHLIRELM